MSHHYDGRGFRIHYVEQGKGEPIVFAHGYAMDHTMFAAQFEDLPDTHRCLAWDMRGHGQSAYPDGPWTMDELTSDLLAFIEATDAKPCHLVGMSIGGMIAIRAALRDPQAVLSLCLIDTSADAEEADSVPQYRGFMDVLSSQGPTEELIQGTLPLFFAERFLTEQTEAVGIHVRRVTEMDTTPLVETLRALVERDSVASRLGEIAVPTLVMHGEQDAAIGMHQAQAMATGIPGATLVTVPQCGHTPPVEAPDLVNARLAEFYGVPSSASVPASET